MTNVQELTAWQFVRMDAIYQNKTIFPVQIWEKKLLRFIMQILYKFIIPVSVHVDL